MPLSIVRKQIKQRNDSIEQFENAGRSELAEKEKAEIVVLEKYLPAAMSSEEVSAIVAAAVAETGASSRADMGKVMGIVQSEDRRARRRQDPLPGGNEAPFLKAE